MTTATIELPRSLRLIADYCGDACMYAVWRHYGGIHLYVPERCAVTHPLVETLGAAHAQALVTAFPGETLYIAKFDAVAKVQRATRDQAMLAQRRQGWTLATIARYHQLTERQVINIINAGERPVPQLDLFSD